MNVNLSLLYCTVGKFEQNMLDDDIWIFMYTVLYIYIYEIITMYSNVPLMDYYLQYCTVGITN